MGDQDLGVMIQEWVGKEFPDMRQNKIMDDCLFCIKGEGEYIQNLLIFWKDLKKLMAWFAMRKGSEVAKKQR